MELTMTNGFSELSFNEMEMIDGGGPWEWFDSFVEGLTGSSMEDKAYGVGSFIRGCVKSDIQKISYWYEDRCYDRWGLGHK